MASLDVAGAAKEHGQTAWRCQRARVLPQELPAVRRPAAHLRHEAEDSLNAAAVVKLLRQVSEELCAYLLLFIEVRAVGTLSIACPLLRDCLWVNDAFWKIYAGPCLCDELEAAAEERLATCVNYKAAALRERFRKWLFHLDGEWTKDFRNCVEEERRSAFGANFVQLFGDARFVTSGLMPYDSHSDVDKFVALLCELLAEYCPAQLDERRQAEALIAQVERREGVFTEANVSDLLSAYDRSLQDASLDEFVEDNGFRPSLLSDPLQDQEEDEEHP